MLPAVAKVNGLPNAQSLQQFLVSLPWQVEQLREKRLDLILKLLKGRKLILVIDETGDRKTGRTTDYIKRQYIGNLGKVENGIVSVDAYGVIDNIAFPPMFDVYKPKERLKEGDLYQSKPKIAADMIQSLCDFGVEFKLVGRYDRIDFVDDGLELIDYKSAKSPTLPSAEEIDLQLGLYYLALE